MARADIKSENELIKEDKLIGISFDRGINNQFAQSSYVS